MDVCYNMLMGASSSRYDPYTLGSACDITESTKANFKSYKTFQLINILISSSLDTA